MDITKEAIDKGQAVYTPLTLMVYDIVVLAISNRFIWKCPTTRLNKLYCENISNNHLDIGVGTGYFLKKNVTSSDARVALVDLNSSSLDAAANRLLPSGIQAEKYQRDILSPPIELGCKKFDSVGINYLFHCIPGDFETKARRTFESVMPYVNDGAKVFGSTICPDLATGKTAKKLMATYQEKGIFNNQKDFYDSLVAVLNDVFQNCRISKHGCVAIFEGEL